MLRMDATALICALALAAAAVPARAGTYKVLHDFRGSVDGANPTGDLINVGGTLYGTTSAEGRSPNCGSLGCGTLFSLNPSDGAERVLHQFNAGHDGANPHPGLIAVSGILYGTTYVGGTASSGTVFSFNPSTNLVKVLHAFRGGSDGAVPQAGVIALNGTLYGTTTSGRSTNCSGGCGTVFSLVLATGAEAVVHGFQGGTAGAYPYGGLVDVGGTLYGTTDAGGAKGCLGVGCGTVFALNPKTRAEKLVYAFQATSDGAFPQASLLNLGGTLYGTTGGGGSSACPGGCGTVFKVDPKTGVETVVRAFLGGSDGFSPYARVIDVGGTLYGTTAAGGGSVNCPGGCGTVFSLDPASGAEHVLHAFAGGKDGAAPMGGLVDVGGTLYGTTQTGGAFGSGTAFRLTP